MNIHITIEGFMQNYGYLSTFILIFLEYANLPLPSEIVLPLVGVISSKYNLNIFILIILSVIGGLLGSLTNYYLGYKYGRNIINKLSLKSNSFKKSLSLAQKYIHKYDKLSILLARIVPLARTTISLIAGVSKISLTVFVKYSILGISIWNGILIYLGYLFNDNLNIATSILSKYSKVSLMIVILIFVLFFIKKKKR